MKTLTLINEVNDDVNGLFPGVDASAFGGKKKDVDINDLAALTTEQHRLRDISNTYYRAKNKLQDYLEHNHAMIYVSGTAPDEVVYTDFDWLDKYEAQRDYLSSYAISKKSPLFNDIEKHIRNLNSLETRSSHYSRKSQQYQDRIKTLQRKEKKARTGAAMTAFGPYAASAPKLAPPNIMPTKIPVAGSNRRPVNNPYNTPSAKKQYAGHVAHYPHWSSYWKDQIMMVEEILKRNGKGGLGMMYASTHDNGGGRFNFVITGANGNLTWRKYDPSPGAGQNWMILDGKKINTSQMLTGNKAIQDKYAQMLP